MHKILMIYCISSGSTVPPSLASCTSQTAITATATGQKPNAMELSAKGDQFCAVVLDFRAKRVTVVIDLVNDLLFDIQKFVIISILHNAS